ncbi:helix-turn-helix domain-containing protein [Helicobacter sp. faydin-H20]|uniref:helix-turn-helix domain-containing protein n=1 Tax=Helicobacter anatolicus TaxID=2905874 RepID=UPI001E5B9715|nr:helix-turn-helix domain-containing protein [Helicobacter anatolicus]MCE3037493.1 helix-turn-helix domain-containing protein [Helicobacter anatolicus]
MTEENIVKKVCKELNITQKELSEILGVAPNTATQWATQIKPPQIAVNFMELLIKNKKQREQLEKFKKAFNLIDEARKA